MNSPNIKIQGVTRIQDIDHGIGRIRGTAMSEHSADFVAHHNRLSSLRLIRPIFRLIKSLQAHRGISTANLSGGHTFVDQAIHLQEKISRTLLAFEHLSLEQPNPVFDRQDIYKINSDWLTIRNGWRHDDVIENFEFHSHLIHHLTQLAWQTIRAQFIDHDYHLSQTGNISQPISSNLTFIRFCFQQIPTSVEQIAKLRGLATHCAEVHKCDENHQVRVKYLCRKVCQEQQALVEKSQEFNPAMALIAPSLPSIQIHSDTIAEFKALIQDDILTPATIDTDSEHLFMLATKIIDSYVNITEQAINALEQGIKQEIDAWYDA